MFLTFFLFVQLVFAHELAGPLTDLTDAGNIQVVQRYQNYLQSGKACHTDAPGPRVILTGFGLYFGVPYNLSGAVIDDLSGTKRLDPGRLTAADQGVRLVNRTLSLDGRDVQACLMVLDVQWDFAAAVLVHEMENFQPNAVVMTGLGDPAAAIVESGALNQVLGEPGFNWNGDINSINSPVGSKILDDQPDGALPMTWNATAEANAIRALVEAQNVSLETPSHARTENDYICNNIAYTALAAARGIPLHLASAQLNINPHITSNPRVGFFHVPAGVPSADIPAWADIVRALAHSALDN